MRCKTIKLKTKYAPLCTFLGVVAATKLLLTRKDLACYSDIGKKNKGVYFFSTRLANVVAPSGSFYQKTPPGGALTEEYL